MWPWAHLGFGYLLYSCSTRLRTRDPPEDNPTLVLAVGTQFPDFFDKPLALIGLIPRGRAITHSILIATLIIALVALLVEITSRPRETTVAFGIGYGSHLAGDSLKYILAGNPEYAWFLAWPFVPFPTTPLEYSLTGFLAEITFRPVVTQELMFVLGFLLLWMADGLPGLWPIRGLASRISG